MIHTDKIKKSSGHTDKVIHSWGRNLLIKKKTYDTQHHRIELNE